MVKFRNSILVLALFATLLGSLAIPHATHAKVLEDAHQDVAQDFTMLVDGQEAQIFGREAMIDGESVPFGEALAALGDDLHASRDLVFISEGEEMVIDGTYATFDSDVLKLHNLSGTPIEHQLTDNLKVLGGGIWITIRTKSIEVRICIEWLTAMHGV